MIRTLYLLNAGPFRGEHTLELGAKAYAITARFESDAGRSNTGGKSFLLEMIDFALTGRLAKFRRFTADGWISKGEREGKVMVVLEDGTSITRSRVRGQPTQVTFGSPEHGKGATQDAASVAILKHLAFDANDFRNVAYFEQKQMARFVLTEPGERLEIVNGWFGLGKAEAAEERTNEIALTIARDLTKLRGKLEALVATMPEPPPPFDVEHALKKKAAAEEKVRELDAAYRRALDAAIERRDDLATVADYDRRVEIGKFQAGVVAKISPTLEADAKAALEAWEKEKTKVALAWAEEVEKRKVSLGQFDGRCPVAKLTCPVAEQINTNRAASKLEHAAALKRAQDLEGPAEELRKKAHALNNAVLTAATDRKQLEAMRKDIEKVMASTDAARKRLKVAPPVTEMDADFEKFRNAAYAERDALASAISWNKTATEVRERLELEHHKLIVAVDNHQRDLTIATRARGVFRATQRRVSERALGKINQQASHMLANGGIDLSVELRWERDGKDPAKQCEECGSAFPASAKVKTCATCGAPRGKHIVQGLEFVPSDRSGAADDIAGITLQLAAGSWFLAARSSPWATAMLDEPLGSCDTTNRRALSMQLAKLLHTGTWRQALIISHNPDTVELYPGRITILVGRDGTRRIEQS